MKKDKTPAEFIPSNSGDEFTSLDAAVPETDYPSPLIYRLSEFYRKWPDYPTNIVDIAILSRLLHTELDKFLHRPHRQVTQIFFDNDTGDAHGI